MVLISCSKVATFDSFSLFCKNTGMDIRLST
jgi:hypothetical protein